MFQAAVDGLIQGVLYAGLSVAFSLIWSTTRVFYIALGAIYMASPYLFSASIAAGIPWYISVLAALLGACVLSELCEFSIHWPLTRKYSPPEVHFIASLGAFLVIVQSTVLVWGSQARFIGEAVGRVYLIGGLRLTKGQVAGVVVGLFILIVVFLWLRFSNLGLALRAMASNAVLLSSLGWDICALRRILFAASAGMAAAMSLLSAFDVGYDPQTGMKSVFVGLAATIIGGRSSFAWAAVAGIGLGLFREMISWYFSPRWDDAATLAIMALILLVYPRGLGAITRHAHRVEEEV